MFTEQFGGPLDLARHEGLGDLLMREIADRWPSESASSRVIAASTFVANQ